MHTMDQVGFRVRETSDGGLLLPVIDLRLPAEQAPLTTQTLDASAPPQRWFWHGLVGPGAITMLTSLWKSGKTTLAGNLLRAMYQGKSEFVGLPLAAVPALVITEEFLRLWRIRLADVPADAPIHFVSQPFLGRPTGDEWRYYVDRLVRWCRGHRVGLVVIDPIANLIPGDENSAAAMLDFLHPLQALTRANVAVLLLHHPRKSDGGEGRAARGSGALAGAVDVVLEMRRQPLHRRQTIEPSRTRYLTAYSRHPDTPLELIIELTEDRRDYLRIESTLADELGRFGRAVLALLNDAPEPMSAHAMLARWPITAPTPTRRQLEFLLHAGLDVYWTRQGDGTRARPFRYQLLSRDRAETDSPSA